MSKASQHIVFFTPGFPADENDLNCIPIIQAYVEYFKKLNPTATVSVIAFQYPFKQKIYQWHQTNVYAAAGKNKKYFRRLITWFRVWKHFQNINKKTRVDVIHCFWLTECAFLAQWLQRFYNVKVIATILGQDCLPSNKYLKLLNFSRMKIIASSKNAAEIFFSSTKKHTDAVISIGLDVERFNVPISEKPEIDILGVGNLYAVKNYELFIDVVCELISEFPKLKALIAGDGVDEEKLQKKIDQFNLNHNIKLAGRVNRNDVIKLMSKSKILLHTSLHEGQGFVFEEALYSGMSIVAFRVGNLYETERIRIANSKQEMIGELRSLLLKPVARTRILMHDLSDTINSYNQFYQC